MLEHRFKNFSEDFAIWVLFYGPEGGEQPLLEGQLGHADPAHGVLK